MDFGVCATQSASFALATTHSQDVLFNASRPHRRSPSAYFEGTHGVRSAWGNTDAIDFVAIASSLQATNGRRAVGNTNRLKAVSLRFVRQLRTQTAQSLVLSVKLGARYGRRLAAPIPSSKSHIPFIRTLQWAFISGATEKLCHCEPTCSAWQSRGNETTNFFCARTIIIHY